MPRKCIPHRAGGAGSRECPCPHSLPALPDSSQGRTGALCPLQGGSQELSALPGWLDLGSSNVPWAWLSTHEEAAAAPLSQCCSLGWLLINVTSVIFSLPETEAPLAWSSFSPWHPSRCPGCLPGDVFVVLRHFLEPEPWGALQGLPQQPQKNNVLSMNPELRLPGSSTAASLDSSRASCSSRQLWDMKLWSPDPGSAQGWAWVGFGGC